MCSNTDQIIDVAVLVNNKCIYDSRVIRTAEALSDKGYRVIVICKASKDVPSITTHNNVTYKRVKVGYIRGVIATLFLPIFRNGQTDVSCNVKYGKQKSINDNYYNIKNTWAYSLKINIISVKKVLLKFVPRYLLNLLTENSFYASALPILYKYRPSVIHANELNTLNVAIRYKENNKITKVVYDSHELEIGRDHASNPIVKKLIYLKEGRLIKKADRVITVSNSLSTYLSDLYNICKPYVVYNAPFVPETVDPKNVDRNLRQETGVDYGIPLAVYVGKLKLNRGHEIIIEALAYTQSTHLAMIGPQDDYVLDRQKKLVSYYNLEERVHFVKPVHVNEVVDFISLADFGVVPTQNIGLSYRFAMPNKLFEMTLSGLPVIAGDLPDIKNYILTTGTGLIMNEKDPRDVARAMDDVYKNLKSYQLNDKRRRELLAIYSGQAQKNELLRIYSELVN